jgi:hypothetical protein
MPDRHPTAGEVALTPVVVDVDRLRRHGVGGASLRAANLRGANLADLDLRGVDLRHADLRGADVTGADLSEANLAGAVARGAKFHRARMTGANLAGAELTATNLTATDLRGARLAGAVLARAVLAVADLRGADLSGADLRGAVLLEARVDGANLIGARLKGANVARTILAPGGDRYLVMSGSTAPGAVTHSESDGVPEFGHVSVGARPMIIALVDLTGYTEFVKFHEETIEHAHEVVSDLLDHLARRAEVPLTFNKFEGDAILLHADVPNRDEATIGRAVVRQLLDTFPAFDARIASVRGRRHRCPCLACQSVGSLALKIVAHRGRAAVRRVRHLDEIGGVDVIVAHRLLKNAVPHRQYLLATEALLPSAAAETLPGGHAHSESYDHLGTIRATVYPRPRPEP